MMRRRGPLRLGLGIAFLAILSLQAFEAMGQTPPIFPTVTIGAGDMAQPQQVSVLLQILFLLTVLSLAPAILVMMTSFTRLAVVFSMLRQALGTQQMPPNQILIGLA